MRKFEKASTVNVCYATDDNYAPHLCVSIYSMLRNRNRSFDYDIWVIVSDLSTDNRDNLLRFNNEEEGIRLRLFEVKKEDIPASMRTDHYITIATYFRFFLFTKHFEEYEKIIYLDCDTIIEGDIAKLFTSDMEGKPIAAVEETGFRQMGHSKRAVFLNGNMPYNVDNYRTDALKMQHPESYFNAGVMLLDLVKCREKISFEGACDIIKETKYFYNDQDVLNIQFDGQVKLLDFSWNYQNSVDLFIKGRPEVYGPLYEEVKRENPDIIHYVSSRKPWKDDVMLGEHFHKYKEEFGNN